MKTNINFFFDYCSRIEKDIRIYNAYAYIKALHTNFYSTANACLPTIFTPTSFSSSSAAIATTTAPALFQ